MLLTLPWYRMQPAPQLAPSAIAAAATPDGRHALIFTAHGKPFTVEATRLGRDVAARWFDPTTGRLTDLKPNPLHEGGQPQHVPPGLNGAGDSDWVLLLEATPAKP